MRRAADIPLSGRERGEGFLPTVVVFCHTSQSNDDGTANTAGKASVFTFELPNRTVVRSEFEFEGITLVYRFLAKIDDDDIFEVRGPWRHV